MTYHDPRNDPRLLDRRLLDPRFDGGKSSNTELLEAFSLLRREFDYLRYEMLNLTDNTRAAVGNILQSMERLEKLMTPTSVELRHSLDEILQKTNAQS